MTKQDSMSIALKSVNQAISLTEDLLFKNTTEINNEALTLKLRKLGQIGNTISSFYDSWNESGLNEGFISPERMVDTKLISTGHLDVKQLKKTIIQINMADVAIRGLDCVSIRIDDFLAQIQGKETAEKSVKEGQLLKELIKRTNCDIEKDAYALRQQRDNASLYYQIFMVSRAVKVAYASIAISGFAFLLTILQAIHIL